MDFYAILLFLFLFQLFEKQCKILHILSFLQETCCKIHKNVLE